MLKNIKKYIDKISAPLFLPPVNRENWNQRVLLIKIDAIGDFFLFTGPLRNYLRFYNDKEVYLAVDKCCLSIAKLYLPEERLICVDRNKYYVDPDHRLQVLSKIRDIGFATVIGSIVRMSIQDDLALYSSALNRYGLDVGRRKKQLHTSYNSIVKTKQGWNHVLDREVGFYNGVTGDNFSLEDALPYIPLNSSDFSIGHPYFVLLPEAGDIQRMYPWNKYVNLINTLNRIYRLKCVVLGGGKSSDFNTNDNSDIINMVGKTNILRTLEIIKNAEFVIGNETGVTHAAWIMEKPTVMICGEGHSVPCGGFWPLNQYCQTVNKTMDCCGCGWECKFPLQKYKCIKDITVDEILNKLDFILNISNFSIKQEVNKK